MSPDAGGTGVLPAILALCGHVTPLPVRVAALRASAACAAHTPPALLQIICSSAADALQASVLAGNAHLLRAALAGLQSCGSDVLKAMVDAFRPQSDARAANASAATASFSATSVLTPQPPPFPSVILQALSPPLPLLLPLSPVPPPCIDAIQYPFSVSAEQAAVMLEEGTAAAAAAAAASKVTTKGDKPVAESPTCKVTRLSRVTCHTPSHVSR